MPTVKENLAGAFVLAAGVALGALAVSSTSPIATPAAEAQAPRSPVDRAADRSARAAAREAELAALRPSMVFAIVRKADGQIEEYRRSETAADALEDFIFPWKFVSDGVRASILAQPGAEVREDGSVRIAAWEEEHYKRADYEAVDTTWNGKAAAPIPDDVPPGSKRAFDTVSRRFVVVPE